MLNNDASVPESQSGLRKRTTQSATPGPGNSMGEGGKKFERPLHSWSLRDRGTVIGPVGGSADWRPSACESTFYLSAFRVVGGDMRTGLGRGGLAMNVGQ